MPLSDTAIRQAKAAPRPIKLFDERGLFLLLNQSGSRYWRFKYRINGKEKLLALGGCVIETRPRSARGGAAARD
jgi:hypothetical protein